MTEQVAEAVIVYAEFRDGYWYTSDDSPTDRQIMSETLDGLIHAVNVNLPGIEAKVVYRLPEEMLGLEEAAIAAEERVKEAQKQARLARLRYESAFQRLGISVADTSRILGLEPQTVKNNWSTYKRLERE